MLPATVLKPVDGPSSDTKEASRGWYGGFTDLDQVASKAHGSDAGPQRTPPSVSKPAADVTGFEYSQSDLDRTPSLLRGHHDGSPPQATALDDPLAAVNTPGMPLVYSSLQATFFLLSLAPIAAVLALVIVPHVTPIGVLHLVVYGGGLGGAYDGDVMERYYLWRTVFPGGFWGPMARKKKVDDFTGATVVEVSGKADALVVAEVGLTACVVLSVLLVPLPILAFRMIRRMNAESECRKLQLLIPDGAYLPCDPNCSPKHDGSPSSSITTTAFATPIKVSGGEVNLACDVSRSADSSLWLGASPQQQQGYRETEMKEKQKDNSISTGEPETVAVRARRLFQLNEEELNEVSFQPSTGERTRQAHALAATWSQVQRPSQPAALPATSGTSGYELSAAEKTELRRLRLVHGLLAALLVLLFCFVVVGLAGAAVYYRHVVRERYTAYRGQETRIGTGLRTTIAACVLVAVMTGGGLPLVIRGSRNCDVLLRHGSTFGTMGSDGVANSRADVYRDVIATAANAEASTTKPAMAADDLQHRGLDPSQRPAPREGSARTSGSARDGATAAPFIIAAATSSGAAVVGSREGLNGAGHAFDTSTPKKHPETSHGDPVALSGFPLHERLDQHLVVPSAEGRGVYGRSSYTTVQGNLGTGGNETVDGIPGAGATSAQELQPSARDASAHVVSSSAAFEGGRERPTATTVPPEASSDDDDEGTDAHHVSLCHDSDDGDGQRL